MWVVPRSINNLFNGVDIMSEKKYIVKVLDSLDDSFIAEWKALWERGVNGNIFNSYEWFLTCEKTYHFREFAVYACYEEERLVGVLAVVFSKLYGVRVASVPGGVYVVEPPVLLEVYDGGITDAIFGRLGAEHNFFINKINKEEWELVRGSVPGALGVLSSVNPYLEIGDDPFRFVSKNNMSNLGRKMRKYKDNFSFEMYDAQDDLNTCLQEMIAVEQESSKKREDMDLFSSEVNREIYKNMIKYCRKFVSVCFLRYDDKAIAYSFNFTHRKVFLFFQTAFLFEYRKMSPGKVMVVYLLRFLKEHGFGVCDFSGGVSRYKRDFVPEFYFQYNVMYSRSTFVMGWWSLVNSVRRIRQVLLPKKNTKDHEFLFRRV